MAFKDNLIGVWCEAADPTTDEFGSDTLTNASSLVGTATGKVGTAGDFPDSFNGGAALYHADDAANSTGDIDFTVAAWVYANGLQGADNNYIASKGSTNDNVEWGLLYKNFGGENTFQFFIATAAVSVNSTTFGHPSTGTWYYVQGQHDSVSNKVRIRVNNGAWDEAATGGTSPGSSVNEFLIGALGITTSRFRNWYGRINQVALWKAIKSDADLDAIYNADSGLAFGSWDAAAGQPTVRRLGGVAGCRPVEIGREGVRVYRTMPPWRGRKR